MFPWQHPARNILSSLFCCISPLSVIPFKQNKPKLTKIDSVNAGRETIAAMETKLEKIKSVNLQEC